MTNSLAEQIAIVTGATSGIGRAIVDALAESGAALVLLGRRQDSLESVSQELRRNGREVTAYKCDLLVEDQIRDIGDQIGRRFARIDILIHCAGTIALGPIASAPVDDLDLQYRINVRAPYLLTQLLLPQIISSHGQVVFVNSSVGIRTKPDTGAYAATKHALKAIADTLRMEVNAQDVRVLTILPGNTATAMQETIRDYTGASTDVESLLQPEDVASIVTHALLMPRTAEVTDISIRPMRKAR
jgi:NADP-dependent 3-hydroxy acid dehydrogenase YdfG